MTLFRIFLVTTTLLPVVATGLSLIRNPHWLFRVCDFPRIQIAALALISGSVYFISFRAGSTPEVVMLALAGAAFLWQVYKIYPYTPLGPKQVVQATEEELARQPGNRFTLMMSNVLMENEEHGRLVASVKQHEPDIVLIVEINDRWMTAIQPLLELYPYSVRQPQENYYGMVLLSRLELVQPQVSFLVQDDIPSIRTAMRLESGVEMILFGLHPRPPEPIRDQLSAPRDAELVVVGRAIEKAVQAPTLVAGDLNDVAWSDSSELFVRLSGLLDPRAGRGFYNSYNAKNPLFRFPLDHVFHSNHFKLVSLQRLPSIGSDHFPILIELLYEPEATAEQSPAEKAAGDDAKASEKLGTQAEAAATGDDRPNDD